MVFFVDGIKLPFALLSQAKAQRVRMKRTARECGAVGATKKYGTQTYT